MYRKKFYCYRSFMGEFWSTLSKNLPQEICQKVRNFWLVYSVECMFAFPEFDIFRASYEGVEVTFQQYVNGEWCCKVKY